MITGHMTQLSLIPLTASSKEKNRKHLLASIKKKRAVLEKLVIRSETLKVRLDMLKGEYLVKIGSLVVKDNHLDLEIITLRNTLKLMQEGKSYLEAVEELSHTFFAEQLEIEKEEEKIRLKKETYDKRQEQRNSELFIEIKKVWRHLIALFHPDLIQDPTEKKRREEIMKQINQAYEEGDLTKLSRIELEQAPVTESTMDNLEEMLAQIEQEIHTQEILFQQLKDTEWYHWDKKITKNRILLTDLFKDLEKKLLNDIVEKIDIIKSLKEEIEKL